MAVTFAWSGSVSFVLYKVVGFIFPLRADEQDEWSGMDSSESGRARLHPHRHRVLVGRHRPRLIPPSSPSSRPVVPRARRAGAVSGAGCAAPRQVGARAPRSPLPGPTRHAPTTWDSEPSPSARGVQRPLVELRARLSRAPARETIDEEDRPSPRRLRHRALRAECLGHPVHHLLDAGDDLHPAVPRAASRHGRVLQRQGQLPHQPRLHHRRPSLREDPGRGGARLLLPVLGPPERGLPLARPARSS